MEMLGIPAEYGEGRAIKIKFIRKIRDNYGIAALMLKVRDIKYSKSTLQSKADDKFLSSVLFCKLRKIIFDVEYTQKQEILNKRQQNFEISQIKAF